MSIRNTVKKSLAVIPIAGIILFSSVSVKAELGDSVLKSGSNHKDVQVLQEKLIELNFLNIDKTTTYYGDTTVKAVKDFQSFYGLKEDGTFGPGTFKTLQKASKATPLPYKRLLKLNMTGEDVKHLQERLNLMGYLDGRHINSKYGTPTRGAVAEFQRAYGLKPDGIAGSNTFSTINKALNGSRRVRKPVSRGVSTGGRTIDNNIIATAKKYIGTPYRFGGNSSSGIDCSGFTQLVYKNQGVSIPRTTTGQAKAGTYLSKSELKTGDLVIFSGTYRSGPSHAGIYVGDGNFIHASSSYGVTISSLNSNYYSKHFSAGRRVY